MLTSLVIIKAVISNAHAETISVASRTDFGGLLGAIAGKLKSNVIGPLALLMILVVAGLYIVGHQDANEKLKDVLKGIIVAVGGGALIKIFMG